MQHSGIRQPVTPEGAKVQGAKVVLQPRPGHEPEGNQAKRQKAGRLRYIFITSCGWKQLGVKYGSWGNSWPTLSEAVQSKITLKGGGLHDLIFDCRMFKEPLDDTYYCTGENYKTIDSVVNNAHFVSELGRIKAAIYELEDSGKTEHAKVAFVCCGGNHRGPAMARIVQSCLDRTGYLLGHPNHMSRWVWPKKGKCTTCNVCTDEQAKEALLLKAFKIWNTLPDSRIN